VNVNDDGPNSPQTAALTGTGLTPVSISPTSLGFGAVLLGSNSMKTGTLTNNQNVALTNVNITIIGAASYSQVNTCGTSVPANGQCTITVTFAPVTSGVQSGTVNVSDSAGNSPQTVALTGSGSLPLTLSPTALNFGSQTVGTTSAPKNITVTNHEKVTVTFSSVAVTGIDSSEFSQTNNCSSLSPGQMCTVAVTFTPSATGNRTASLTLTDSATNSPQTAKLSGTGAAPKN
jgi:hypothetical protein